ncbi:MAG: acyl-CoA thioesterase [Sphingobacteriales bacterium]|nr:acyl-CoA thioesterase [Sphingobacteriales bacterium]
MRWLRLLLALLFAKFRVKLDISETSFKSFRVWLTDIDASIMNHAAILTVFESGRIDFMVRTGFFTIARKRKWYFPSSSISVQFFRPLKVFQKAVVLTRIFHVTDYFIYTEQKIIKDGKDIALCIVKSKVKSGKENIGTQEITNLLNAKKIPAEERDLIEQFERQDEAFKKKSYLKP